MNGWSDYCGGRVRPQTSAAAVSVASKRRGDRWGTSIQEWPRERTRLRIGRTANNGECGREAGGVGGASSKCSWWCCCCRSCRRRRLDHSRRSAAAAAAAAAAATAIAESAESNDNCGRRRSAGLSLTEINGTTTTVAALHGTSVTAPSTIAAPEQVEDLHLLQLSIGPPQTSATTGCDLSSAIAVIADQKPSEDNGKNADDDRRNSHRQQPQHIASAGKQQQLHDIEEEDDDDHPLSNSSCSLTVRKTTDGNCNSSPSSIFSSDAPTSIVGPSWLAKAVIATTVDRKRKKNLRAKSATTATERNVDACGISSSGIASTNQAAAAAAAAATAAAAAAKMQAEQGSIGDLQKYHKFLRNRRHTLANVR